MSSSAVKVVERVWGAPFVRASVALAAAGALAVAFWLQPDVRGFGTHEQLGLAPCTFEARTGIPCPGCGLTTSLAHAAHGHFARAFATHAAGAPLFLLLVWCVALGVSGSIGRPLFTRAARTRITTALTIAVATGGVLTFVERLR